MSYKYPIGTYHFEVYIGGIRLGFQKITNITVPAETEIIVEGGCDYVHILPGPVQNANTMTFYKGSGTFDPFIFPFSLGQYIDQTIHIIVYGPTIFQALPRLPRKHYCIEGAIVTGWQLSDLDAESGEVLIESFEIQYERLTEKIML